MKRILLFILLTSLSPPAYMQNMMVAYEYWFNSNYQDKVFSSVQANASFHLSDTLQLPQNADVLNWFHIRFKDANGKWSSTINQVYFSVLAALGPRDPSYCPHALSIIGQVHASGYEAQRPDITTNITAAQLECSGGGPGFSQTGS